LAKEANTDGNGTIKLSEFLTLMGGGTSNDVSKEEMGTSSSVHDENGDGHITTTEMADKLVSSFSA